MCVCACARAYTGILNNLFELDSAENNNNKIYLKTREGISWKSRARKCCQASWRNGARLWNTVRTKGMPPISHFCFFLISLLFGMCMPLTLVLQHFQIQAHNRDWLTFFLTFFQITIRKKNLNSVQPMVLLR